MSDSPPAPVHPPQAELIPADEPVATDDDADSSLGADNESSTASLASSVLNYRTIRGRTYHSDRYPTEYYIPNDQQQLESLDMTHHYLTVLLDDKLFLAPISKNVQKVVDIGTGSGIWAIDFADEFPKAEVIGTDLSPCQPQWVPPNLRFEVDDATLDWTWTDNSFDFIHMRYLFGAIKDWTGLFKEAYRCAIPGGWVESVELDATFRCDDGTLELEPVLTEVEELYRSGGEAMGREFFVHDLQPDAMKEAGFVDIATADYKLPVGAWPKEKKLSQVGEFLKTTIENDVEGYTSFIWNNVLQRPKDEYQVWVMRLRKAFKNSKVHSYMKVRYVYGRKPE